MDATTLVAMISGVPYVGPYAVWIPVAVLLCSVVDAVFPQPVAGSIWVKPRQVVSLVSISILHARNAVPAGAPPTAVAIANAAEAVIDAQKSDAATTTKVVATIVDTTKP